MSTSLSTQLREVIDSVEPITLEELRLRIDRPAGTLPRPSYHRRISSRQWLNLAAILVIVGILVSIAAIGPWAPPQTKTALPAGRLGANSIRLIADASTAALRSGRAHMDIVESFSGTPEVAFSADITFSGQDLDMVIGTTTYPPPNLPPGLKTVPAPTTSTSDVRLVDGNVYRTINGANGVPQWYVETGPNASTFLSFPDPRTFVRDLNSSADLVSLGQVGAGAAALTHLQAKNPAVLGNLGIAGLGAGQDTAFDAWVDANGVVQRMSMTSTGQSSVCSSQNTPVTTPMTCTTTPEVTTVSVAYFQIGVPQSIATPSGAIPGSWPSS